MNKASKEEKMGLKSRELQKIQFKLKSKPLARLKAKLISSK